MNNSVKLFNEAEGALAMLVYVVKYGAVGCRVFASKEAAENWRKDLLNPPKNQYGIGPIESTLQICSIEELRNETL